MRNKTFWVLIVTLALAGGSAYAGGPSAAFGIANAITAISSADIESSGIAQITFGNVETPQDAIRHPWQYPHLDANRSRRLGYQTDGTGLQNILVTRLGNTSGANTFGAAWIGKVGNAYLGAQFTYETDEHVDIDVTSFPGFDDTDMFTQEMNVHSAYYGVGWGDNEKITWGVGFELLFGEDNFFSSNIDTFGGFLTEDVHERDDVQVTYGVKFTRSEAFSWWLSGQWGDAEVDNLIRSTSLDAMGVPTVISTNQLFDLSGTTLGVYAGFNWYKNNMDWQILTGYRQTDYDLVNTAISFSDIGGMFFINENITADSNNEDWCSVGVKVGHHNGPFHVYGGVDINHWSLSIDLLGDFDDPTNFQFTEFAEEEFTDFVPNVGFIYEWTDHVALVAGARYVLREQTEDLRFTFIDVMMPSNNSTQFDRIKWTTNNSEVRAGLELRYDPVIVDVGLRGQDEDGQEALDAEEWFISATFLF